MTKATNTDNNTESAAPKLAIKTQTRILAQVTRCQGITVRTTNHNELNPDSAKLPRLWERVYHNYFKQLKKGSALYGIYHNYESDALGAFDVTAGWREIDYQGDKRALASLESVTIPTGRYLVFTKQGEMPKAVINAWQAIWTYFNDLECRYERCYQVDFEHYVSETQVDVYIGVK